MSLPLLVRPNSVIPIGNRTDKPDYDYGDAVTLRIYPLEEGKQVSVQIPTLDGKIETSFDIERSENIIQIQRQGPARVWNVLLVGIDSIEEIENVETVNGSALIKVNANTHKLMIRLR
jgi:alpha-D-xyloside xylohydrolase